MINYLLLILNIISYLLFFCDKQFARKNKGRISEKTLLLSAFLAGGLGAFLAMYSCRHKTKKLKFVILVPLFLIIQLIGYLYICFK